VLWSGYRAYNVVAIDSSIFRYAYSQVVCESLILKTLPLAGDRALINRRMPAPEVGRGRNYVRRRDNLERAFERDDQTLRDPGLPSRGARDPQPWYAGPKPPTGPPPRRLLDQAPLTPPHGRPSRRGKGQSKVSPTRDPKYQKVQAPTPNKVRPGGRPRQADQDSAKPTAI
jgi:hypothetical protein